MPSTPFPLLRTPHVVIREVLKLFHCKDLVLFSLCSKRTTRLVKLHNNRYNGNELHVNCDTVPEVRWCRTGDRSTYTLLGVSSMPEAISESKEEIVEIRGHRVPIGYDHQLKTWVTYWDDPIQGMKNVVEFLSDALKCPPVRIGFDRKSMWALDWANSIGVTTVYSDSNESFSEDEYAYILQNCAAPTLDLCTSPVNVHLYRYTGHFLERDTIRISNGMWMTLDNLINLKCAEIKIDFTRFTYDDLNEFLKQWLAGKFPRLERASIAMNPYFYSEEDLLKGIENPMTKRVEWKEWKRNTFKFYSRGWDIKMDDGRTLTACYCYKNMSVCMAVWPQ
ncbi:hypothetical protein GCK72_015724 [Caenorhabditis remanei]|uniref:F-box domain-containing protein n=1 Tax=Caenorhabditis remanei TaxID=31234 RepID=A0A6A5GUU6_CAERE|nr:hypothetical protein GCK72_015724 [Caenorhabditis remanei]KAF1759260.1 hypothetical protein GCK72_015724 [Caenorhabditis remanei]